jgi:hypothetical protein
VLPHCMEPFRLRVVQSLCEILREDPRHCLAWRLWTDRVFYQSEDGTAHSLSELWGTRGPGVVNHFVGLVHFADRRELRPFLRPAFADRDQPGTFPTRDLRVRRFVLSAFEHVATVPARSPLRRLAKSPAVRIAEAAWQACVEPARYVRRARRTGASRSPFERVSRPVQTGRRRHPARE